MSPTSVVQLESPFDLPPNGPNSDPNDGVPKWTRFVLLSDTHTSTFEVPLGDVLLYTGDLTNRGTLQELKTTMEWLYALPHPIKM